ncbi:MAG: PIN domain-containing protein [Spirochaeta sp.]|nr:PIN domain-containing protein [Spirochaeta sp.]
MTYLLDTNVISEIMRRDPNPQVFSWFTELNAVPTSVICLEELVFGLRRRSLYKKEAWLRRLLTDKGCVYLVSDSAAHWSGQRRAAAELQGVTVHQADALIAACAWEHGLVLATRNTRDFESLGIALFNPFA